MQKDLIDKFLDFLEENISDPRAEKFINLNRTVVSNVSDNKQFHNQRMSSLFYRAKQNMPATIQSSYPQNATITFQPDDFGEKKQTTQPAPVADSEIKAQAVKEASPMEKEIFDLYSLGVEKAEQQYKTIEAFVEYATTLKCDFAKPPKTFNAAWITFEKYFRKTMGI